MFSIMLGILASVLPNIMFVWLGSLPTAKTPRHIVRFFYLSEILKFAGLAFLISLCLQWPNLHTVKFFIAFLLSEFTRVCFNFFRLTRTTV